MFVCKNPYGLTCSMVLITILLTCNQHHRAAGRFFARSKGYHVMVNSCSLFPLFIPQSSADSID